MALQPFVGTWSLFPACCSYTQSVGLLGQGIIPSQRLYIHTEQHKRRIKAHFTDIHASTETRTHDPSVRASEVGSCLRPRGHCDRHDTWIVNPKWSWISTPLRNVSWLLSDCTESCRRRYYFSFAWVVLMSPFLWTASEINHGSLCCHSNCNLDYLKHAFNQGGLNQRLLILFTASSSLFIFLLAISLHFHRTPFYPLCYTIFLTSRRVSREVMACTYCKHNRGHGPGGTLQLPPQKVPMQSMRTNLLQAVRIQFNNRWPQEREPQLLTARLRHFHTICFPLPARCHSKLQIVLLRLSDYVCIQEQRKCCNELPTLYRDVQNSTNSFTFFFLQD
jgi:hypothetical protein